MALNGKISCYRSFSNLPGFPEVYWLGWKDDYTIMAFELLGPSLEVLFEDDADGDGSAPSQSEILWVLFTEMSNLQIS